MTADASPQPFLERVVVEPSFVPQMRADVSARPVGNELVVLGGQFGHSTALNPVGSAIWPTFDGSASLEEIAVDVADAFSIDIDTARSDLVDLATQLHVRGVLSFAHIGPSTSPSSSAASSGPLTLLPEPPEP